MFFSSTADVLNTASTIFCILCILFAANLSIVFSNNINSNAVTAFDTAINNISNQSIDANVILVWNNLTTQLGIEEKLTPPEFSRVYALVHVSMYDSLLAAAAASEGKETWNYFFNNNDSKSSFYITSIAEAASAILLYLFPNHANDVTKVKSAQINGFANKKNNNSLSLEKASQIGHVVSQAVINYGKMDNSDIVWNNNNTILAVKNNTSCTWNGTNPVNPTAGFWKTYILTSGAEVQQQGPARCGSEADLLDLRETYHIWKNKTSNQIKAVHYWGDKPPPVIWNNILNQQIQKYNKMSIFDAAYASVYLNIGMYDAFVSCWYAKYDYWSARPFQRINNITTVIPTPNFPGYTSGHSVISMVASKVLGEIFPQEKNYFHNQGIEAGLSRLWAGIHFKQDVINGMDQGDKIANKIVGDMHKAIHPFIYYY
ncbi:MAG TPA: vanadium-dependent haloperoxidase [Nitrososphaeraceae archaeon]